VTYYADDQLTLHHGDSLAVLRTMPDESVHCVVTSPPYYGLRDYGEPGQYGLEPSPAAYVETMRAVFAEVRRVLAADGTLWLNLGDSYSSTPSWGRGSGSTLQGRKHDAVQMDASRNVFHGLAPKNLLGVPWRVALALQDDGWILRNAIVWDKPNAMPESATDRMSTTYELVFLFARSRSYWFDLGAGANPGDIWALPSQPFPEAHFAVMPAALAERCIVAGCRPGGTVLDPFCGSGTTGMVALKHGPRFVGIDLSAAYLDLALRTRLSQGALIEEAS
jgi:DNA modification methylase